MASSFSIRRLAAVLVVVFALAAAIAWQAGLFRPSTRAMSGNSIAVIAPYRYAGTWVFDDPSVGLVREAFVGGSPEVIDLLVADIPDAADGFRLTFSATPFPGYEKKLTWLRGDKHGNYYQLDDPPMEGWLCPGLFKYYVSAPKELYIKADPKK
jgi:hypothetical protein